MTMSIQTGMDIFLQDAADRLLGQRVGLVTNHTGVTSQLEGDVHAFQRVLRKGLCALFGPEHGFYGHVQDRERIDTMTDPESGLPVYSLYGPEESPSEAVLQELDVLIFDIQDVGVRFYTYLTSMYYTMQAAAVHNVSMIILDRPNPVTGTRITGPILSPALTSFEGACEIPIRHGMTLGEIARYLNETSQMGVEIDVIPMFGWRRSMWYEDTGLVWVPTSPNMPTINAAVVYPGMCLFEGTNLSEGRGTTHPFELIGAPWIDSLQFSNALNNLQLPGVRFRSAHFLPTFWKLQGVVCHGVQVHVIDRETFEPVKTALSMITTLLDLWPDQFEWIRQENDPVYFFDRLIGNEQIRPQIMSGESVQDIVQTWQDDEEQFRIQRQPFLLYKEL